jgi:hypothetical protein
MCLSYILRRRKMKKFLVGVLMVLFLVGSSFAGPAEVVFDEESNILTITKVVTKDNASWKIEHTKCYLQYVSGVLCEEKCMEWDRNGGEVIPEGATHVRHTLLKEVTPVGAAKITLMDKTTICTIEGEEETSECTICEFNKVDGPGGFGSYNKPVAPTGPQGPKK